MGRSPRSSVNRIIVTEDGVCKLFTSRQVNKAMGPDVLPIRILKELAEELTLYLLFPTEPFWIKALHQMTVKNQ